MNIHPKDCSILYELSLNGRASLSDLAKKTKLSKEVIHHRIKNLEKNGIIEGFYAVINTYRMGMIFYRVYMKTSNMNPEVESEFVQYLKDHPKVTWVVEVDGDIDFLYVVWGKNINEFEQTFNEINDKFAKYVQEKYFSVMTNVYYMKYKFLTGKNDPTYKLTGGNITTPDLDEFDLNLISLLSNKGRLSLLDTARHFDTNVKFVQRRMRKLLDLEIISCYNVKINHKALGFVQRKVMLNLNDASSRQKKKIIAFLLQHKLTIYITIAIGQYDLEFEIMERSHEEFHDLLKDIKTRFPSLIKNYFTVVFYNEPKVGQIEFN